MVSNRMRAFFLAAALGPPLGVVAAGFWVGAISAVWALITLAWALLLGVAMFFGISRLGR